MTWTSWRLAQVIGAPSLRVERMRSTSGSMFAHSMSCSIETRSVGSIVMPGGSASSRAAAAARAARERLLGLHGDTRSPGGSQGTGGTLSAVPMSRW